MCPIGLTCSLEQIILNHNICLCQSLGVCVCADNWVGPDCSVPRDSNSLVWETLLDPQLTLVSTEYEQHDCCSMNFSAQVTQTCVLFIHRTRRTGSSTGWATHWCLNHRVTSGCMVACRCQRAFWEMFTGIAIPQRVFTNMAVTVMILFLYVHTLAYVGSQTDLFLASLDILCQSAVGPKC